MDDAAIPTGNRKSIYVAGPMRGYPRFNVDAFDAAARKLQNAGWRVFNPAQMDRENGVDHDNPTITDEGKRECIRRDLLAIIDHCDAIALMPGWEKSKGVKAELALAEFLDLKVIKLEGEPPAIIELGVEFSGGDNAISREALRLQGLGAKFECRNDFGDDWDSQDEGCPFQFIYCCQYRMVSPPPVTLEIGEEFTTADIEKCEYAKELQAAGAVFESRWNGADGVGSRDTQLHFDSEELRYRLAAFPPEQQPESTTPFEVGKCYANKRGDVFEVTAIDGEDDFDGVSQPIEAVGVKQSDHGFGLCEKHTFSASGAFYGDGTDFPEDNLIPVEVPRPSQPQEQESVSGELPWYAGHSHHHTSSADDDRQTFSTGAVRSSDAASTRYDLISHIGLRRIAETYAEGAIKYDDNNWLKGFPASDVINHCVSHIYKWLSGDESEDHLAHAAWNLIAVMHFEETKPELIDCYHRQAGNGKAG